MSNSLLSAFSIYFDVKVALLVMRSFESIGVN